MREPPRSDRNRSGTRIRAYVAIVVVALLGVALLAVYLVTESAKPQCMCPPLGPVGLAWGMPVNATGSTPAGCPVARGHYCYTIQVAGSDGLVLSELQLSLRNSEGAPVPWPAPPTGDTVSLACANVTAVCGQYNTSSGGWSPGSPSAFGGDTIVIFTPGVGAAYGLRGDEVVGTSVSVGNSASSPSNPFP